MKFMLDQIDGCTVLTILNRCQGITCTCLDEPDYDLYNWLFKYKFGYLLIEFENESNTCQAIVTSVAQLAHRLAIPTCFLAKAENLKSILKEFAEHELVNVVDKEQDAVAIVSPLQKSTGHLSEQKDIFFKVIDAKEHFRQKKPANSQKPIETDKTIPLL